MSLEGYGKLPDNFTIDGRFIRTDIWRKEGKYVDLWSGLHVLSGVAIGFYPRYFGFGMIATFVIVLLILIMYEMFEVIAKIEEYPTNRVSDVVFGMIGFTPIYFLDLHLSGQLSLALCVAATAIAIVVAIIAWTSSYKAYELERKMRAEYEEQKARVQAKREKRRLRGATFGTSR